MAENKNSISNDRFSTITFMDIVLTVFVLLFLFAVALIISYSQHLAL